MRKFHKYLISCVHLVFIIVLVGYSVVFHEFAVLYADVVFLLCFLFVLFFGCYYLIYSVL